MKGVGGVNIKKHDISAVPAEPNNELHAHELDFVTFKPFYRALLHVYFVGVYFISNAPRYIVHTHTHACLHHFARQFQVKLDQLITVFVLCLHTFSNRLAQVSYRQDALLVPSQQTVSKHLQRHQDVR